MSNQKQESADRDTPVNRLNGRTDRLENGTHNRDKKTQSPDGRTDRTADKSRRLDDGTCPPAGKTHRLNGEISDLNDGARSLDDEFPEPDDGAHLLQKVSGKVISSLPSYSSLEKKLLLLFAFFVPVSIFISNIFYYLLILLFSGKIFISKKAWIRAALEKISCRPANNLKAARSFLLSLKYFVCLPANNTNIETRGREFGALMTGLAFLGPYWLALLLGTFHADSYEAIHEAIRGQLQTLLLFLALARKPDESLFWNISLTFITGSTLVSFLALFDYFGLFSFPYLIIFEPGHRLSGFFAMPVSFSAILLAALSLLPPTIYIIFQSRLRSTHELFPWLSTNSLHHEQDDRNPEAAQCGPLSPDPGRYTPPHQSSDTLSSSAKISWPHPSTDGLSSPASSSPASPSHLNKPTPSSLAIFSSLPLPACLQLSLAAFTSLSLILALIFTKTRSAWLAFLTVMLLLPFLTGKKKFFLKILFFLSIFSSLSILLLYLLSPALLSPVIERVHQTLNGYSSGRDVLLKAGIAMIKEKPLFGHGPGGVRREYGRIVQALDGVDEYRKKQRYSLLHNNFLQAWAELGLPGLLGLIWLKFIILIRLYRLSRSGNLCATGAFLVFAGWVIAGLFECNLTDTEITRFLWLITGMALSRP